MSIQPTNWVFVKGFRFLSFIKNMSKNIKNIGKNISKISKTLSGKYTQKHMYHTKKPATDALKTVLKNVIQKRTEETETGDLISNKIADKIKDNSPHKNSDTDLQSEAKMFVLVLTLLVMMLVIYLVLKKQQVKQMTTEQIILK